MVKVRYKSLYWRREKEWFSSDKRVYIGEEKRSGSAQIKEWFSSDISVYIGEEKKSGSAKI